MANELSRLVQGVSNRMPTGTDTLFFILKLQVLHGLMATCANTVCDFCPLNDDPYNVHLTVGGDCLEYPHDPAAPAASFVKSKLIFNSTIWTPGARFFSTDIKDYIILWSIMNTCASLFASSHRKSRINITLTILSLMMVMFIVKLEKECMDSSRPPTS